MWSALYHNETEWGYEPLPIWDTIATYNFLTRLQGIAGKRDAYLSLVVINLANDTCRSAKGNALDWVSLGLSTAGAHRGRLLDNLLVNFDLALHDVSSFKDWWFEVIADMFELDTAQADCVVVFEPECDRLQLRDLLYVKSLKVCLCGPLEIYLLVWDVWYAPKRQLAKLSSRPSNNSCQFVLFEKFEQVFLLLFQEILDASLRQFCSLLCLSQIQSPNILIFLQQLIECLSVEIYALFILREIAHQKSSLEPLLVQLILEFRFNRVSLCL